MSVRDRVQRRVVPRAIVGLSRVEGPRRTAAAVRRARGGEGTVRLLVAFDDPYSAVAAVGLAERLAGRRAALVVEPVVARGIADDPAVDAKRAYALVDSRRLAARDGRTLARSATLDPEAVAFLAHWACALPDDGRTGFAVDALQLLWGETDGVVDPAPYAALWREHGGTGEPPVSDPGVAANEQTAGRRGLYDTPIARVHGRWFFAHERLEQIAEDLDELGWRAAA